MSHTYSAHPALASEQLERAEHATSRSNTAPTHHSHRRHNSAGALASGSGGEGVDDHDGGLPLPRTPANLKSAQKSAKTTTTSNTASAITEVLGSTAKFTTSDIPTLPDRTNFDYQEDDDGDVANTTNTKDCVDCAPSSASSAIDEPDHLQHRFSRIHHTTHDSCSRQQLSTADYANTGAEEACAVDGGCASGLSSTISSPSPSTVSSPLSTPTRLAPHFHHHCCQKVAGEGSSTAVHHHHHLHHTATAAAHAAAHTHHASSAASGCKKLQKFDPRLGPSPYRQLLPIALCILSFATVFSILIVYMDTTEIRHQQFRLNMSRDSELFAVAQDDPKLIAFLREIHMRKYPMHFLKNREAAPQQQSTALLADQQLNFSSAAHHDELAPEMAHYVANLVGGKTNGAVIQSLPGPLGHLMTAPWLAETLNWAGIIVEPEPRRYFTLRKQNARRSRMQVVHACVSPNPYPKEITIHNEESEVRINSLLDEETSWFNSRVKCFPLYTVMLACNRVEYDLLSLGVHGHELEILQTLPFDKIKVEVISIHLPADDHEPDLRVGALNNKNGNSSSSSAYIQSITKFLMGKSYKLQRRFGRNYFYQRINSTSRTRKKDILLLKTP